MGGLRGLGRQNETLSVPDGPIIEGCLTYRRGLWIVPSEGDLEALYYLSDVRCLDKENLLGFTLEFHFDENPFFSNQILTKRYDTANIMDQVRRACCEVETLRPRIGCGVGGIPVMWILGKCVASTGRCYDSWVLIHVPQGGRVVHVVV